MTTTTQDSTRVTFRGTEIALAEAGEPAAPPLGFLHGMLGVPPQADLLSGLARATGRRVVAPTLPGFSPSDHRPELRQISDWVVAVSEIIDLVGLTGAPIVAASTGAMLAFEVAAVRPEALSAIIAIAPLGLWDERNPITDVFACTSAALPGRLLHDPAAASSHFLDDPSASATLKSERAVARHQTQRAAASLIWPIPEHGLVTRIHRVSCPVGLIWGAEDQIASPDLSHGWIEHLPSVIGSTIIPSAGHCAEWDRPQDVARAAADFLRAC